MAWTATLRRSPPAPYSAGPPAWGRPGAQRGTRIRKGFLMGRGASRGQSRGGSPVGRWGGRKAQVLLWLGGQCPGGSSALALSCSPFSPCFGGSPRGSAQLPGVLRDGGNGGRREGLGMELFPRSSEASRAWRQWAWPESSSASPATWPRPRHRLHLPGLP